MVQARSQYKTCLRKARVAYDKSETDKLRYRNARDYWKLLKSASQSPKANIPLSTFTLRLSIRRIVIFMYLTMVFFSQMICTSEGSWM